jgi:hypothetical protein
MWERDLVLQSVGRCVAIYTLQIVEEINYMFRLFSGWAIIRVRLEYRRNLLYYSVDIENVGTRSRFTKFGEVCSYIYASNC